MRMGRAGLLIIVAAMLICTASILRAATPGSAPTPRPTTTAEAGPAHGKDVIILNELVDLYEAVPFSHATHAKMADMWNGCETCHHHTPNPSTQPSATRGAVPSQNEASAIPACKSCHPVAMENPGIVMPSLKGAYHRQCLNCHREWMDSNACTICHAARPDGTTPTTGKLPPQPDDITGRMHKPIPAPTTVTLTARYTPVAGANVTFRHDEHARDFGIRCVTCHQGDSCSSCHSPSATNAAIATTATASTTIATSAPATRVAPAARPLKPSRTWRDTHGPCVTCHDQDRCAHCHYQPNQTPPPAFDHQAIPQTLDEDHIKIACAKCHIQYKPSTLTCGDSSCHNKAVTFPADRPGAFNPPTTRASTGPATTTAPAATSPATRPIITKIRRGGA